LPFRGCSKNIGISLRLIAYFSAHATIATPDTLRYRD
jgi:hypothetical protein